MPKIFQYNNDRKFCRKCDKLLIIGENWTRSNQKQYNYICNFCSNAYTQARRAKNKKPKSTDRFCNDCGLLLTDDNWASYNKNSKYHVCNSCQKNRSRKWYNENIENSKASGARYRAENNEKLKEYFKKYHLKNRDLRNLSNKERYEKIKDTPKLKESRKIYRENNKESLKIRHRNYKINRKLNDPSFKLRDVVSVSIRISLKNKDLKKIGSAWENLPYTPQELKSHIEAKFEPWMNWNNWGLYNCKTWDDNNPSTWKWNLDHIIPHSKFAYTSITDDDFKKCWALDNLRPLSAKQNVIDGASRIRHKIKQVDTKIIKE